MAVATSSIFSQIDTDAALAVLSPANKSRGPAKPLKKIMPTVFALLPDWKSNFRLLPFLNMNGNMAKAAPK